ncbi:MAG: hypothetical protein AAF039_10200 [Bacteroidota bacterium]
MEEVIQVFLVLLGTYSILGFLFALYFLFVGVNRMDPLMADTKKSVRLLLFPGVLATWPFLIYKLRKSKSA